MFDVSGFEIKRVMTKKDYNKFHKRSNKEFKNILQLKIKNYEKTKNKNFDKRKEVS
jgi:hypothetical protein